MRLGTCIALELVAAASAIGGIAIGAWYAIDRTGDYVSAREASAAELAPRGATIVPAPLSAGRLELTRSIATSPATVFDAPDDELLAPLAATPLGMVKLNRGGTSLSLRLEFASGARAAFKPEQIHLQSNPRREIAAYRLDRLLGIGHVPPAKPGAFAFDDLVAAADPAARANTIERLTKEGVVRRGVVHGELSWWIPEIRDLYFGGVSVDDEAAIAKWTGYLQVGAAIPSEVRPMIEQLATCVVFDVLVDNADRWSGSNTKSSPDHKILYFMDNTLSFSTYTWGHASNLGPLHRIQVFPRQLIERVRALTVESVTAALALEPGEKLAPLLAPAEIRAILARRDHVVHYIDALVAQYGQDRVLGL